MKKRLFQILALLVTGSLVLTSCNNVPESSDDETSPSASESSGLAESTQDLALGAPYFYGFGLKINGDNHLNVLNDGNEKTLVTLLPALSKDSNNETPLTFTDWYATTHTEQLKNDTASVTFDLGFLQQVSSFAIGYEGEFEGIDVYTSNDGYNFTDYYPVEKNAFENGQIQYTFSKSVPIKAIRFDFPAQFGKEISLSTVHVYGTRGAEKISLKDNATYRWLGNIMSAYPDKEVTKLLDGEVYSDDPSVLAGKTTSGILIDLGEEKNLSEVYFDLMTLTDKVLNLPNKVLVDYSLDGNTYSNLGSSYLATSDGVTGHPSNRYFVTRNNTVSARYLRITFGGNVCDFLCDEIFINGAKEPVAEPQYEFLTTGNASWTNIAPAAKSITPESTLYTDLDYLTFSGEISSDKPFTISLTYDDEQKNVCGAVFNFSGKPGDISSLKLKADEKEIACKLTQEKIAEDYFVCNVYFSPISAKNFTFEIQSSEAKNKISEVSLYSENAQLPLVKGGFFQLPTSGGGNEAALSSEYSWYLQLKGMRELGMEYVVLQYSTNHLAKTTLINGTRITEAGYQYSNTYGVPDVPKAILDAADKLGMKVWLGTIHDSDFTTPSTQFDTYEKIVADAKLIIADINDLYGSHSAFAGYYLSDETCDAWLHLPRGVEACRYIYKQQSDFIHSLAPEASIMIAPAIWRSGKPAAGADYLYEMIKPDQEGDRPVVDIVAAQDCLGRESTLTVTDAAYKAYLSYVQEWAVAVRKAGAEFWHDAEVFEITSTSKRYADLVKTLSLEAPLSGSIIVFDIPHYFSVYSMSAYNDLYNCYKQNIMKDYVKYVSSLRALLDS